MSQMTPTKKSLMNLGLNPDHLVRFSPDWVDCFMAYYLRFMLRFLLISHAMVTEVHLHFNK